MRFLTLSETVSPSLCRDFLNNCGRLQNNRCVAVKNEITEQYFIMLKHFHSHSHVLAELMEIDPDLHQIKEEFY